MVVAGRENGVVLRGLNNAQIMKEEVQGVVNEVKARVAAGLHGCVVECLKSGVTSVTEWLVRLLSISNREYSTFTTNS